MTPQDLFDSFTFVDWILITIGCVLVILIPALFVAVSIKILAFISLQISKFFSRSPKPEAAPSAEVVASLDAEWADIEEIIKAENANQPEGKLK